MSDEQRPASPLTIALFGPWDVRLAGQPLPPLRSQKSQWLLALLALQRGRAVDRAWLAGTLWPDSSQRQAAFNLSRNLTDLRHVLGPEARRLDTPTSRTLRLDLVGAEADVLIFDEAIASGDAPSLEKALALRRGPLLQGCHEEWVFPERQAREEAYLAALERLAAQARAQGDDAAVTHYLRRLVAADPLRDSAQCALMQALAAGGDLAAATQVYRDFRLLLHRELNATPDPLTTAAFQQIRTEVRRRLAGHPLLSVAAPRPAAEPPSRLPRPLTHLIGREHEVREIRARFAAGRLVTLTGPGGVGKTRLALQVASELLEQVAAGAWFVELAPLVDASLVPQAVAATLSLQEAPGRPLIQTLIDFLKPRQLLLVLDNCEHLAGACAQLVETLLHSCPQLQLLATSREALGIAGESRYRVPSLSLPPLVDGDSLLIDGLTETASAGPSTINAQLSTLVQYEAVRLFIERAAAAQPDFALSAANAPAVTQICRQLDGIPLALELAAPLVRALPVTQIAQRLDDRFRLLNGGSRTALPRHQTLQALIDWSHDLLSEPERTLLRRLSVFAGGWTLEAAEAVCAGRAVGWAPSAVGQDCRTFTDSRQPTADTPNDVLDLHLRLVDKSLVVYEEHHGEGRYRLLETMREYARERLLQAGEEAVVRGHHLEFFLRLAEEAGLKLNSEPAAWLALLEVEQDNVRASLEWSLATPGAEEAGMRLAHALWGYWYDRGVSEGREWLKRLLERSQGTATAVRAGALEQAGTLARDYGDTGAARALLEESLALSRELGDRAGIAGALHNLGKLILNHGGDEAVAELHLEESLALWRELGEKGCLLHPLFSLGDLAQKRQEYTLARSLFGETLTIARELGDRIAIHWALRFLGNLAWQEGDYPAAGALLDESLTLLRASGFKASLAGALMDRGLIAYSAEEYGAARAFYSEGMAIVRETRGNIDVGSSAWRLERFAQLAATQGQGERSVRLFGAAEALRESVGGSLPPNARAEHECHLAAARAALGEEAFAAAWAEGRQMPLVQAVCLALEESDSPTPDRRGS